MARKSAKKRLEEYIKRKEAVKQREAVKLCTSTLIKETQGLSS